MNIRRLFRNPLFLIVLTAMLTSIVVQSGELGSSDTSHRLQAAHSFWTSEPEVFPEEYPEFGIHGRSGRLYGWYGVGQSLLMLPFDILGTYLERLPLFANYGRTDPTVRDIVVTYSTNTLICVLVGLVCFRFLRMLGFSTRQAVAGVLALLFCTTHLHYTQNMMENNYIMLLTLTGLTFQYEWLCTDRCHALLIGCIALGANLLTRLTTGMDLLAVSLFLLLTLWFSDTPGSALRSRFISYFRMALPVYVAFGLIERAYQYYRFGSFFSTYLQLLTNEHRKLNSALAPAYPFETPFRVGFLGPLITPEKSIFLFDPLLVLTVIIGVRAWKRFRPEIRAYFITFVILLFAYISLYAKYTDWSGDHAWGDRYVSTAAQLVAFFSVPLLLRHRINVGKALWRVGLALVVISVAVQLSSLVFWCPLEIYQMQTPGQGTFVIALRVKNILAYTLGRMSHWGLVNDSMQVDPWDYVHITTLNFLPFLLRRVGQASGWLVTLLVAVWLTLLIALIVLLVFILKRAAGKEFGDATVPVLSTGRRLHTAENRDANATVIEK